MSASNSAVWLLEAGGDFVVKEAPLHTPGPDEVLIKNKAVAVNPMDWKIQVYGPDLPFPKQYPFILGGDIAGEIYEVGQDVTTFKKGDRVMGVANWFLTNEIRDSGFQNYTICKTTLVSPLPDTVSFESGSVLPIALSTAAMGLYPAGRLELPLPHTLQPKPINKVILVWGGSSSTGSATIQLAVASGATVIATASAKNHSFVQSLGAAKVLDYHQDSIIQDLVKAIQDTPGEFVGALDAIAEEGTVRSCADVVKGLGGGRVVTNLPMPVQDVPDAVEVVGVADVANISDFKEISEGIWGKYVPEALMNGTLKAVPEPLVVGEGLGKVPEGVSLSQQGISAKKIVVTL
ncbi:chaperonin 10-like protein [Aspergillus pseudonomiae]|uniref:Chaperonin 10-like protein n=1 Tax=Aspergillus pseudonomiae TaxID=1506151 RepID=A0A5N6I3P6_9EURO|nr:chaperonin 10-like protein [Aspergillus pseudonomiae]KAB8260657.1 chaperonin 10-like protein [Aspergillus pseudonomiae]KAE8403054.1 chaperonin 10-like protein [Aspergillus pseudonomiae]